MTEHIDGLTPTSWDVATSGERIRIDLVHMRDGSGRYAVRQGGDCLSRESVFDYEPLPSSRSNEFLDAHRFDSLEDALAALRRWEAQNG